MGNKQAMVLLVDDIEDFAKEYAETLQRQCGTPVMYATTAEDALEKIKNHSIKVVILDQKMPTKGTELFHPIKRIDRNIKTILLTGESKETDLKEALNIGFDYALFKEADDMAMLPTKILLFLAKYDADMLEKSSDVPVFVQKISSSLLRKKNYITYLIQYSEIIDSSYTDPASWKTSHRVVKGETITQEEQYDMEKEFDFQNNFKIESENSIGLSEKNLLAFEQSLSTKMAAESSVAYKEKMKRIWMRKQELAIPKEQEHVVSIEYQYAKMYQQIKVYIRKECSCCDQVSITPITVLLPIPKMKYKIVEHYDDNTSQIINTGEATG